MTRQRDTQADAEGRDPGARPGAGADGPALDAPALFEQLWQTLSGMLGMAAAAALLRRSVKVAAARRPQLAQASFRWEALDYHYALPPSWPGHPEEAAEDLRALLEALCRLSSQLTGRVVVRRLASLPELQRHQLLPAEEPR